MKYIIIILVILFSGCNDDSYLKQIYNKELIKKEIKCLKLKLNPYSNDAYDTINKLYEFNYNCKNTLEIKYETNISCNSNFNTNKQFQSFIQLSVFDNNKLVIAIYKDLKDENIKKEIIKGYQELCKIIKL